MTTLAALSIAVPTKSPGTELWHRLLGLLRRRAATDVGRILNGAQSGDLPVEQPTMCKCVIILKTAQALGLTMPPSLLFQATEVIR